MIVYGDHDVAANTGEGRASLKDRLRKMCALPAGLERHAELVSGLIEAGQLLQGIADAEFEASGEDRRTHAIDQLGAFACALAAAVRQSWDSGFATLGPVPEVPDLGNAPRQVRLRVPEGFAFYAVYPEAYVEAARRLKLLAPPRVIGIRSIGTTLAAIVAAALDAPPPVTVRPFGDPFARRLAIAGELERELLAGDPHYVIIDEGPGQSGSSFGAVADWLQSRGVPLERIAFVPSHAGEPGPRASQANRERWREAQRTVADWGPELPRLLRSWLRGLIGPIDQCDDISAGEWRRHVCEEERDWPAVMATSERRKFLVTARRERFLLKFEGLGPFGLEKLAIAQALHSAGFTPEPIGLIHGFLVERWSDGRPLSADDRPVRKIGQYIGTRSRLFPAAADSGASIDALLDMCRHNLAEEFGDAASATADEWQARLNTLRARIVRSRTDNRLQRHEWLRAGSGRLIKTDAIDHHAAHDLIGCQDMAWDVAGAISEFELNPSETRLLVGAAQDAAQRRVEPLLLDFTRLAYAAFGLGQARLGAELTKPTEADRDRLTAAADRYRRQLDHLLLQCVRGRTRQESSVGETTERTASGTNARCLG